MAKDNMVAIPIEEYKALLVKEMPTETDRLILNGIIDAILDHSELVDIDSYSSDFKGIQFKNETQIVKEIMQIIYALDRPRFIEMYKSIASEKKLAEIEKINMEYVRKIKELKNDD